MSPSLVAKVDEVHPIPLGYIDFDDFMFSSLIGDRQY